ncbi:hypothetical protein LWI28_008577 [Acer negundo]|uniref:DNA mismatch repair proteins mutS family domain-containing protein n=1 Tax=Acer negundo TaxID=4023 RepID=A0AAD5IPJ7_ACENE|nr:hypothetical protein LWI28_008577 [Acer negundo]
MEEDGGERSSFVTGLIENRAKEVGVAAFDLRSATLHLSQYIETSSSYQNTKTLLHFYDPMVIIVSPNKFAPDGMVGVSELVDRFYASVKKGAVLIKNLAAKEPSALGLDTYYKQYYLCLAAAAATIKWTRLLRANLLQPLKDIETINTRLDCLDELMSNEQLFFGLSQVLRKFPKETGEVIDEDVLHARVPFVARTQQCFAVKAGIDGLLDIARRSFCDTSEAIHSLATKYREDFKVANLKLPFNNRQGFYFSIPQKDVQGKLPNKFIQPNNIFISEATNMLIVTGPNMSGKSTYLQQVCLMVILAQIGCYVPAHFSAIRVVDRIFTRMGTVDNLESNSSTFMTEMKETAFIMQNVSQRSLIVMDELGRATSSSDGYAIAWSCCEHLLSLKA